MREIEGGICAIEGVRACGIKHDRYGLALIAASGPAAGVFTQNKIKAAPIIFTAENIKAGWLDGIIANSGCANAYTGQRGVLDSGRMADIFASFLKTDSKRIGVASTGVIGIPLDLKKIESLFEEVKSKLRRSPDASREAAIAIMTTDTAVKEIAVQHKGIKVAGIAKGAGMIEPNMGTMLVFIYSDVVVSPKMLGEYLLDAVNESFNMLIVDGDTSTNDVVLLTTTQAKDCDPGDFREALGYVCTELARMVARDGEGATKYLEAQVTGARSRDEARSAARAVLRSNLVKTAIFGGDPNWGRIVAAVGRSGAEVAPERLTLRLQSNGKDVTLVERGRIVEGVRELARSIMKEKEIMITIDLGLGDESARGFGCDMGYGYIEINASYTS